MVLWLETLRRDLVGAARSAVRQPGVALVAIATTSLGIGLSLSVFSIVHGILWRPLPYVDADRLVVISYAQATLASHNASPYSPVVEGAVVEWRRRSHSFSDIAAVNLNRAANLVSPEYSGKVRTALATANLFSLLGVDAARGRTFTEDDFVAGRRDLVVISHQTWRENFGESQDVIGKVIVLDETPFIIAGVLPSNFEYDYPREIQVWRMFQAPLEITAAMCCEVVARLRPAVTVAAAELQMREVIAGLGKEYRDAHWKIPVQVVPIQRRSTDQVRTPLLLLLSTVTLLVIVGCTNVTSVMLARSHQRERELAVRQALGASRAQLIRQVLTESIVLAVGGGSLGFAAAALGIPVLLNMVPPDIPRSGFVTANWSVAAFGVALIIAAIATSTLPAISTIKRANAAETLRSEGRSMTDGQRTLRWRRAIVAGQTSMVVVLLWISCTLLYSSWRLLKVPLGFQPDGLLAATVRPLATVKSTPTADGSAKLAIAPTNAEENELLMRARGIDGVLGVAMANSAPFAGPESARVIGRPDKSRRVGGGDGRTINIRVVSSDYFQVMGIQVLKGRHFVDSDTTTVPGVCILSQSLARLLFPDGDATRKYVVSGETMEVVGVVEDIRADRPDAPGNPAYYVPRSTTRPESAVLIVRMDLSHKDVPTRIRQLFDIEPRGYAVSQVNLVDHQLAALTADRRFYAFVTAAVSGLALGFGIVGIYGLLAASVVARRREIGVRLALGANVYNILRLVALEGLRPLAIGLLLGVPAALFGAQFVRYLSFDTVPLDPTVMVTVLTVLLVAGIAGCYIPARRAMRIDAAGTLRGD